MASSRIKGITVEIGGNTTGLQKALQSVNSDIYRTQQQLRDVEKLLKNDPSNSELLAQRQKLYAQAIDQTRQKLEALKQADIQAQEQLTKGELSQEKYDALQREIIATEQALGKLEKSAEDSAEGVRKVGDAGESLDKLEKSAEDSAAAMQKAGRSINLAGGDASAGADAIAAASGRIVAATAAAGAALVGAGITYNAEIETYAASFETMLGSAGKATAVLDQLRETAARTPFELSDLASTTQLLLNYGFAADDAIASMNMLGDISQGNADKMQRIATAYGQMSSSGKVMLEDVKQMIEAGFNPLQEISESTGESMDSLYQRISDGTLSVDEITAAMQRSTSQGGKYFQSMDRQSRTLSGQWSTLKDTFGEASGKIMEGLSDWLATDGLPKAIDIVEKLGDNFDDLIPVISGVTAGMLALRTASKIGDTVDGLKNLIAFFGTTPGVIGLATGATLAFAGAMATAYMRANEGSEAYQALDGRINALRDDMSDTAAAIENLGTSLQMASGKIDASVAPAQEYIDRLHDLETQGDLTQLQQKEWMDLLGRLVELYPDLREQIDLETGAIVGGTSALQDYINTWKEKQGLQALEQIYTEALQSQAQAQEDLAAAQQVSADAWDTYKAEQQRASAYLDIVNRYIGIQYTSLEAASAAIDQNAGQLGPYANALQRMIGPIEEIIKNLDDYRAAYDEANGSMIEAQGQYDEAKRKADALSESVGALAAGEITFEEALDAAVGATTEGTQQMTNDISILSQTWAQKIPEILVLVERGLNEQLIAAMHQAGFDFANESYRLVEMSDAELQQLNTDFAENGQAAVDALIASIQGGAVPVESAAAGVGSGAAGGLRQNINYDIAHSYGYNAMRGFIDGMDSLSTAVYNKAAKIAGGASDAFKSKLRFGSPSKVMRSYGRGTIDSYIIGAEDREQALKRTMDRMAELSSASMSAVAAPAAGQTSYTTNATYGGITINAAPGQDPQQIARAVMAEIDMRTRQKGAVFS